jgi:hypothetical protein
MNNEEPITFSSINEYIKENFVGLLMLIFAFFIIYIVDRINQFNAALLPVSVPTPGNYNTIPTNISKMISKGKKRRKN